MSKEVVLVDVDITFVRSDLAWFEWMKSRTKHPERWEGVEIDDHSNYSYALHKFFGDDLCPAVDPLEFWRQENMYDTMKPRPGAVEKLEEFHQQGFEIVFASHIKGNHHKSKYNFIADNVPFMSGFLATKEKGYIRADVVIEDRIKFLNQFGSSVRKILLDSPYEQEVPSKTPYELRGDWNEIAVV